MWGHRQDQVLSISPICSRNSSHISQGKKESSSMVDFRLSPNTAAVAGDDSLSGCQADPMACKFRLQMQSLKGCEELVGVGHVESSAIVSDAIDSLAPVVRLPELDAGDWPLGCIFPGVSQQVLENNGQQPGVPAAAESRSNFHGHFAVLIAGMKFGNYGARQLRKINRLFAKHSAAHA